MNANKLATTIAQEHLVEAAERGSRATVWGIVASSVLAAVKIVGGILGNSHALIADGGMSVREGHALSHDVKDRLIGEIAGIQDVLVHIEPSRA